MTDLRLAPTSSGQPNFKKCSKCLISSKFCSAVLPKPIPTSSTIFLAPSSLARTIFCSKKSEISPIRSLYFGAICMVAGSPCMCIMQNCASYLAASEAKFAFAVMSFIILKPWFSANSKQYSSKLSRLNFAFSCKFSL